MNTARINALAAIRQDTAVSIETIVREAVEGYDAPAGTYSVFIADGGATVYVDTEDARLLSPKQLKDLESRVTESEVVDLELVVSQHQDGARIESLRFKSVVL